MAVRKVQVQAISMVLIAGIVLALAGTAYFWGKPLLEKRSTATDVSSAESFMLELNSQIISIARSGGSKSVVIPHIQGSAVSVNQTGNEILFRFGAGQAMLDMGDGTGLIPVETYDMSPVGSYGDSPRIITLTGQPAGNDQYLMTLRLKYRELDATNPDKGYEIVILNGGNLAQNTAPSRIIVSFIGTDTKSNGAKNGGDLIETNINVTLA